MPFDFGAGSHIIYRDGVDGLADDIKDFSDKVKTLIWRLMPTFTALCRLMWQCR